MQIGRCLTRLTDITLLAHPSRQRRQPDAQILRDLRRVRPLVSASRTASRRNSGVGLFLFPIEHALVPDLVLSIFPESSGSRSAQVVQDSVVDTRTRHGRAEAGLD